MTAKNPERQKENQENALSWKPRKESVSRKREWTAFSNAAERLSKGMKAFAVVSNNGALASLIRAISLEW